MVTAVCLFVCACECVQVRATDGDTRLGGEDIDARLVEHFLDAFKKQTNVDLANAKDSDKKKKALNKLRNACAQLKVDLSRMMESDICLDELYQVAFLLLHCDCCVITPFHDRAAIIKTGFLRDFGPLLALICRTRFLQLKSHDVDDYCFIFQQLLLHVQDYSLEVKVA